MKKAFFPILYGLLALWLLIGCGGTGEQESASVLPEQSASGEFPTEQATGFGTSSFPEVDPSEPASPEIVPSEPASPDVNPSVPVPSEAVTGTPVPSEAVTGTPAPSEVIPSEDLPGSDSAITLIYQSPELPNGCEVTSLSMLLAWAGCPVDKVELSNKYLPQQEFSTSDGVRWGPDPNEAYAGDPASPGGWYCYEGPILAAGNAWLSEQNSSLRTVSLSGLTQEELERYLDDGIPLAAWVTLYYTAPHPPSSSFSWYLSDGSHYIPYSNLHCVVLAGWDGDDYLIANPLSGWQTVSPGKFWNCFDAVGRRAVAVLPAESLAD